MNIQAFPVGASQAGGEYHSGWDGMTLRDYFAAAAMQGLVTGRVTEIDYEERAQCAYKQADAMLKAREQC